ncbi:molybdate ABC transporter permease subunit [Actibacterium sp. XHP0104]|uniref:molybdate ABC transporter permease subunit n=1 Tax=Actibacterium sp. XHP0104 TaxID=2984335 RepID=UPI0021E83ABA|nr:molybdate ABC transporter permease subunit [Actibacterium sp. XHP0104]MCV2880636.1 molybdate ABC transporter permease subunit [Actibacterium sp. XHP0104]
MIDLAPLWLTLKLAGLTTLILVVIGTPLAWVLARGRGWWKPVLEAVTALPLVLPPTVIGFYLLVTLSPSAPLGAVWRDVTGEALTFSFSGLVLASCLYSLPFMVQPLQAAFEGLGRAPLEAAASLRAGPWDAFFSVVLPLSARGYLTALVLSFAHTVGEFGVVLMVGGNIPGRTKVISIAIYEHVETLNYAQAHLWSGGMLVFSFVILLLVYGLNRRFPVHVS